MFTVIMSEIRTTETVILCPLTCSTIYTVHTGCNMSKGCLRSHRARGLFAFRRHFSASDKSCFGKSGRVLFEQDCFAK